MPDKLVELLLLALVFDHLLDVARILLAVVFELLLLFLSIQINVLLLLQQLLILLNNFFPLRLVVANIRHQPVVGNFEFVADLYVFRQEVIPARLGFLHLLDDLLRSVIHVGQLGRRFAQQDPELQVERCCVGNVIIKFLQVLLRLGLRVWLVLHLRFVNLVLVSLVLGQVQLFLHFFWPIPNNQKIKKKKQEETKCDRVLWRNIL